MAGSNIKINRQAFLRKVESNLTPSLRRGLQRISARRACFGIKGDADLAKIMGILNYGDPGHTFPNTKKNSDARKELTDGNNPSALPARPWLDNATRGYYQRNLTKYINDNIDKVVAGLPKRGQGHGGVSTRRSLSVNDFMNQLAGVGAENARRSWDQGHFVPNAPATLQNKSDPRPLHDTGRMNADAITAWTE